MRTFEEFWWVGVQDRPRRLGLPLGGGHQVPDDVSTLPDFSGCPTAVQVWTA